MPLSPLGIVTVEQIRVGRDNLSYLIYCKETNLAALVDPCSNASEAMGRINHKNLELKYIINTHHHGDHTAENRRVKKACGCKIVASDSEKNMPYDIAVKDGEVMHVGRVVLRFIQTPGHTPGGLCIIVDAKYLLTGDTLFIGDCGRTDLPGGSNREMLHSMLKLKSLDDGLIVFPGHDYGSKPYDSLENQKKTNKCLLAKTVDELAALP